MVIEDKLMDNKKIVLLHWNGRFGNRMFTYAFLRHYAEVFKLNIWLPSTWEGNVLYQNSDFKIIEDDELRLYLNQTSKELDNLDARLAAVHRYNVKTGDDIVYMNPDLIGEYGKINVCLDSLCCYHPYIFEKYSKSKMLNEYFKFRSRYYFGFVHLMEDRQHTYAFEERHCGPYKFQPGLFADFQKISLKAFVN